MTDVKSSNVYKKPLHQHSANAPKTGVKRDGFCRVPDDDSGNHSVAGVVTKQFLDFSASKGNDLRKQVGLKDGDKWCLCASRWKEAFDAKENEKDPKVPKVFLHATNEKALELVSFKELKMFAAEPEASNASTTPQSGSTHPDSAIKESSQIGGKEPRA